MKFINSSKKVAGVEDVSGYCELEGLYGWLLEIIPDKRMTIFRECEVAKLSVKENARYR